jgi:hypothetical protein
MLYGDLPSLVEFDLKFALLGDVTQPTTLKMDEPGYMETQRLLQQAENDLPVVLSCSSHNFHTDLNPFLYTTVFW